MIEDLEAELRAVLAHHAQDVPSEARERLLAIDYRPRTWAQHPRVAAGAAGVVAASSGAAVALFGLGSGASPAFAGWSATPTQPASGQTGAARERCSAQLSGAHGSQSAIPTAGWQPVLTDTRGPFTAMILRSGAASATCFSGPSFTSVAANSAQGGGSENALSSSASVSSQAGNTSLPSSIGVMGPGGPASGPITQASQAHLTARAGEPYTLLQGQVAGGVNAVSLVRSDGTRVQATVADGAFVAWWPGSADASSAEVASSSGATTQALTFVPLPKPPCGPASSSAAPPCPSESKSAGSREAQGSAGPREGQATMQRTIEVRRARTSE
jgi:hypothetical protein